MVKSYAQRDLGMYVSGHKYRLPFFDLESKEEDIIQQTITLFSHTRDLKPIKTAINEYEQIELHSLYYGKEEVYPFKLILEVFRYKKDENNDEYCNEYNTYSTYDYDVKNYKAYDIYNKNIPDGQWMVVINIEQEQGDLLEELIELTILEPLVKEIGLKSIYDKNI